MSSNLIGKFRKIIYSSKDFYVVNFKISSKQKEQKELLNINENLNNINLILKDNDVDFKLTYDVEIEAKPSQKYGVSYFVVNKFIHVKKDEDSIIDYLSSSIFKGIGSETAKKIVDTIGIDFIEKPTKYENEIVNLIGKRKGENLINELLKQNEYQNLYRDFIKYELSISILNLMDIVLKQNEIKNFLEDKIYDILNQFPYINFFELDKIAKIFYKNYNEKISDEFLILWIIYQIENNGSTIIKIEQIYLEVQKYKQINLQELKSILTNLISKNLVIIHESKIEISSRLIYEKELFIKNKICSLSNKKNDIVDIDKIDISNYKLDKTQYNALVNSLQNSISIISGGPGTGKTFLINLILKNLKEKYNGLIEFLAPTGKAATQISHKTGYESKTIHSFLKYNEYFFEINKNNPSLIEVLILDEFSMIDINLFYSLLISLPNLKKLIIVGDDNQLPSIGPGYLLNDLIKSNKFNVYFLEKIYRQNHGSLIAKNSLLINQNKLPIFNSDESILIEFNNNLDVKQEIVNYIKNYLIHNQNLKNQQILIPQYKGINGIDEVNILIQNLLFENTKLLFETNNKKYYKNDKVIQLENMNTKNIFNGEIGYIKDVILDKNNQVNKIIVEYYQNKIVEYSLSEFNSNTKLAYAISVHKFQGSECKDILLIFTSSKLKFISKKLFYTAYTRAMKNVTIISNKMIIQNIINNDFDSNRKCNLSNILKEK